MLPPNLDSFLCLMLYLRNCNCLYLSTTISSKSFTHTHASQTTSYSFQATTDPQVGNAYYFSLTAEKYIHLYLHNSSLWLKKTL